MDQPRHGDTISSQTSFLLRSSTSASASARDPSSSCSSSSPAVLMGRIQAYLQAGSLLAGLSLHHDGASLEF